MSTNKFSQSPALLAILADEREIALSRYRRKIANRPSQGCHRWVFSILCLGKQAGLTAEQVIADLADIPPLWLADARRTAIKVYSIDLETLQRRTPVNSKSCELEFSKMVEVGLKIAKTRYSWTSLEEEKYSWKHWLRSLYNGNELLIGTYGEPNQKDKRRILTVDEWMEQSAPRYIIPNTHTGLEAPTSDGTLSNAARGCFEKQRFLLVEMDAYPTGWTRSGKVSHLDQAGLLLFIERASKGFLRLMSITYSGGKSFHGLFEYYGKPEGVKPLYEKLALYGVDKLCANINRWTRCPGGFRDNGVFQGLKYCVKSPNVTRSEFSFVAVDEVSNG